MKTPLFLTAAGAMAISGLMPSQAQTPEAPSHVPAPSSPTEVRHPPLETRIFEVPPDFLSKGSGGPPDSADPFASSPKPSPKPDARLVLEQLGIEFTVPGSAASFNRRRSQLTMTNTVEQLQNVEAVLGQRFGQGPPRQGLVHLEAFSMPPLTARKALIAHPKERGLYDWIEVELAKPDSSVKLERHTITLVRGGQKAKTEGINEIPVPTEFTGPQIPQTITVSAAAQGTATASGNANFAPWPHTGTAPGAFNFRNAGNTLELELTFADDPSVVDLNLAPETTRRVGTAKFGIHEDVYQPVFETQKFAGQASGLVGQPLLLSTFSPPVNTGVPGGNNLARTWLLFVTVRMPE